MKILLFLWSVKATEFKNRHKKFSNILMLAFILIIAGYCSISFSMLLDRLYLNNANAINDLVNLFNISIFTIPIVSLFLPTFKRKIKLFKPYDPVGHIRRSFIEIGFHFCSTLYFILTVVIVIVFLTAKSFSYTQAVFSFCSLFTSGTFFLILQTSLQNGFSLKLRMIGFGLLVGIFYTLFQSSQQVTVSYLLVLLSVVCYHFYTLVSVYPNSAGKAISNKKYNLATILISVYIKTNTIRVNWILAIIVKLLFVIPFLFKVTTELPFRLYYQYSLISTILLFTYIHNNIWGYLKNTYHLLAQLKSIHQLFWAYLLLLAIPLLFDIVTTAVLVFIYNENIASFMVFYLVTLYFNILIGFFASLNNAFEIKSSLDFLTFKSNTSMIFNFYGIIFNLFLSFIFIQGYSLYVLPIIVTLLTCMYYIMIIKGNHKESIDQIFNKIQ